MEIETKFSKQGKLLFPDLPKLSAIEMSALSPKDALKYLRNTYGMLGIDNADLVQIVKQYRDDGSPIRTVARSLKVSDKAVLTWLQRAEELHILRIRRGGDDRIEKIETKALEVRSQALDLEKVRAEEDAKLAADLRTEIRALLAEITPEKRQDAKLKDIVDSVCRLIEKERLVSDKSTVNTATHNVIERITRLDSMSMTQQEELIRKRHQSEPVDG